MVHDFTTVGNGVPIFSPWKVIHAPPANVRQQKGVVHGLENARTLWSSPG